MQRRHEQDIIPRLDLILLFAFELPVRVVDEDEDAGPSEKEEERMC
jgi:hypothetical protein